MAARLTHLEVLKQCIHNMEHGTGFEHELAFKFREQSIFQYACLGSTAPDLYYYYHMLSKKKNRKALYWGNLAHHNKVFEVVLAFLDDLKEESEGYHKDKKLAFALGYLSHCATDIITHPYIFYITGDYYSSNEKRASLAQANHLRVEYALDSYLIHYKWGMSTRRYNYMQYIQETFEIHEDGDKQIDRDIWRMWVRALRTVFPKEFSQFYVGSIASIEDGDILNEAYLGFLQFNSMTDIRSAPIRFMLRALDKITFNKLKASLLIPPPGHKIGAKVSNQEKEEWKYPSDPEKSSNASFTELVNEASRFSHEMICDALEYIQGRLKKSAFEKKYLNYNLDTGLRSRSLKMKEFRD